MSIITFGIQPTKFDRTWTIVNFEQMSTYRKDQIKKKITQLLTLWINYRILYVPNWAPSRWSFFKGDFDLTNNDPLI